MSADKTNPRIHLLRDDVARKIAAGEVIDRPFSVVRELMDNAIDAESREIALYLDNGGISRIRVADKGIGMGPEDLELCFLAHATSKISNEDDIYRTRTMGFRGEALSSIANCSKLDITSSQSTRGMGHKLQVRAGKLLALDPCRASRGTIVNVEDIFYNMPARKKFLKRASGETSTCKNILMDKALPFPEIEFKFFTDNNLKLFYPASSLLERIATAYSSALEKSLLVEEVLEQPDFTIRIVGGRAELLKKDRRYIQIFVNKRRITEYALLQAVQYGYSEYMPGKDFPVAFVFIDINPELVDFNIHPAKKECRFLNIREIHQSLVALVKSYLNRFSLAVPAPDRGAKEFYQPGMKNFTYSPPEEKPLAPVFKLKETSAPGESQKESFARLTRKIRETREQEDETRNEERSPLPPEEETPSGSFPPGQSFKYLGQLFNLFLVAERGHQLFIVDQHAAHERLLFEKLKAAESPMQELMFPLSFESDDQGEEEYLEKQIPFFREKGIALEKVGSGLFEITSMVSDFHSMAADELVDFLKSKKGSTANLEQELYSMAACKMAVKDGDPLDRVSAENLLEEAFKLENPRCPHGRPIWHIISREELFRLMGRK